MSTWMVQIHDRLGTSRWFTNKREAVKYARAEAGPDDYIKVTLYQKVAEFKGGGLKREERL